MRITENMRYDQATRSLAGAASRQAEAAKRASTGMRVSAPPDDPVAAAELTRISAQKARTEEFQKTVSNARSEASLAEGALGEAGDVFARANEIAIQGSNGTLGDAEREGLADEVKSLRDHLVGLANTKTPNGYVFGGDATDTPPFSATGVFSGNDSAHVVEISPGVTVRANASGESAFTSAGGVDVFASLNALETALRNNDGAAVSASITNVEASRAQITHHRGGAGLLLNRLDTTDSALSQAGLALSARQADIGEVDPFTAFSDLTKLSQSLEQAISVARTTLSLGGAQRF
jgi:flagellar hook-associated protein 3 FlgL